MAIGQSLLDCALPDGKAPAVSNRATPGGEQLTAEKTIQDLLGETNQLLRTLILCFQAAYPEETAGITSDDAADELDDTE